MLGHSLSSMGRALMVAVIAGGTIAASASPALAGDAVEVTASRLYVRDGGSTGFQRMAITSRGRIHPVLRRSGGWVLIQFDQRLGWSSGQYLRNRDVSIGVISAGALNVRSGPSTRYRLVGRLTQGQRVAVLGSSGAWYRITFGDGEAWVHGDYVGNGGTSTPPPQPRPQPQPTGVVHTVTASALNMRTGPSTSNAVIRRLMRGNQVSVTRTSGGWSEVVHQGRSGWVSSRYLVRGTQLPPRSSGGLINLPASGAGFTTYQSSYRRWGSPTMIYGLQRIGRRWAQERTRPRMQVGDISKEGGGQFPPHASHRYGTDADVRPARSNGTEGPVSIGQSYYSRNLTKRLIDLFYDELPITLMLFNDSSIPRRQYASGHHNHFHARIRR